jgi:prepilin-type processing-associated H-X9-DG protein
MQVSTTNGGTMEFVGGSESFRHFQVMSNELNTRRVLYCPTESDSFRQQASIFDSVITGGGSASIQFSGNSNLSYFVGIDATVTNTSMFLAGDHNLTNGSVVSGGILELTTNRPFGWTEQMHVKQGNVALADGSVQQFTSSALRQALIDTGRATNRLAMP